MEEKDLKATEELLEEVSEVKGDSVSAVTIGIIILAGYGTYKVCEKGYRFIKGKIKGRKALKEEMSIESELEEENFEEI